MKENPRRYLGVAKSALLGAFVMACTSAQIDVSSCPSIQGSGDWALSMTADEADYRVNGTVSFGRDGGVVELLAVTSEATGELIDSQVQDLRVSGDSVSFAFAPIGFVLEGRCLSPDHFEGRFSVPQPPFGDIHGHWTLQKNR